MNKTLLQTHIDLLKECKRQNQMLQKLIELNMNDMQDIVDQRDWYYDRYRQLKDKYNKYEQEEVIPESFWEALVEVKDREINQLKEHVRELQIGHDRYEKLRRLSPMQFHELYEKNIKTGEHFDKLVDKLS